VPSSPHSAPATQRRIIIDDKTVSNLTYIQFIYTSRCVQTLRFTFNKPQLEPRARQTAQTFKQRVPQKTTRNTHIKERKRAHGKQEREASKRPLIYTARWARAATPAALDQWRVAKPIRSQKALASPRNKGGVNYCEWHPLTIIPPSTVLQNLVEHQKMLYNNIKLYKDCPVSDRQQTKHHS
jgi:hypothetical protein